MWGQDAIASGHDPLVPAEEEMNGGFLLVSSSVLWTHVESRTSRTLQGAAGDEAWWWSPASRVWPRDWATAPWGSNLAAYLKIWFQVPKGMGNGAAWRPFPSLSAFLACPPRTRFDLQARCRKGKLVLDLVALSPSLQHLHSLNHSVHCSWPAPSTQWTLSCLHRDRRSIRNQLHTLLIWFHEAVSCC